MNPLDAEPRGNRGQSEGAYRGQVTATVFITNTVQSGQLFCPDALFGC
jgi:hypothetical protein